MAPRALHHEDEWEPDEETANQLYPNPDDAEIWTRAAENSARPTIEPVEIVRQGETHSFNLRDEFYTAAYVFEGIDSQRRWATEVENHTCSQEPRGQLLDGIALLFARSKNLKGRGKADRSGSSPASNVTATACGSPHQEGESTVIKIYVAKNNGAQTFDEQSDLEFKDELVKWYNHISAHELSTLPCKYPMWALMQRFWSRRHHYYIKEIRDINRRWKRDWNDIKTSQPDTLFEQTSNRLNGRDLASTDPITKDWNHVQKLLGWLAEHGDKIEEDDVLNKFVNRICFFDNESWEQSYHSPGKFRVIDVDGDATDAEGSQRPRKKVRTKLPSTTIECYRQFRKLVKYFKMLTTLRSVWKAFAQFAVDYPGVKISVIFLPAPPEIKEIPHKPLLEILEAWLREREPSLRNKPTKELLKTTKNSQHPINLGLRRVHRTLKGDRGIKHRSFHCELQLLLIPSFYTGTAVGHSGETTRVDNLYEYFGCSKLSCFLCWEVLRKTGFSTKNTHGKLHYGCAFLLQQASANTVLRSAEELATITTRLVHEILKADAKLEGDPHFKSDTATFHLQGSRYDTSSADESMELRSESGLEDNQ